MYSYVPVCCACSLDHLGRLAVTCTAVAVSQLVYLAHPMMLAQDRSGIEGLCRYLLHLLIAIFMDG